MNFVPSCKISVFNNSIGKCFLIVCLMMALRGVFCLVILFLLITECYSQICSGRKRIGEKYVLQYFCCYNAIPSNGKCKYCPKGYITDEEANICFPCPKNKYSENCALVCSCSENERCDNLIGCVTNYNEDKTSKVTDPQGQGVNRNEAKVTDPQGQGVNRNEGSSQSNSVVVYMSCIATIGSTVVIIIALWRNQDWIKKRLNDRKLKFPRLQKGTITINGKKQKDEPTTRKSEHVYDDINEKYMIKDF